MKKKLLWIALGLLGLLLIAGLVGVLMLRSWLQTNTTPQAIVERLEKEFNCRAEVGEAGIYGFWPLTTFELRELRLSMKDDQCDKPLAQRSPMSKSGAIVYVETIVARLQSSELLSGRVHIKLLNLGSIFAKEEVDALGESRMATLFSKPRLPKSLAGNHEVALAPPTPPSAATTTSPPVPSSPDTTEPSVPVVAVDTAPAEAKKPSSPKSGLPMELVIDRLAILDSTVTQTNRQAKTRNVLKGFNLELTNLDIDPSDLAGHNSCHLKLSGGISNTAGGVLMADFTFTSEGVIHPFDAPTGLLDPEAELTMKLIKGSTIGGHTTIGEAAGKDPNFTAMKKKLGIDLSDVVIGGKLQQDTETKVSVKHHRLEFLADSTLAFPDYMAGVGQGSWLDAAHDETDLKVKLVFSDELTSRIRADVTAQYGETLTKSVMGLLQDPQGRLTIDLLCNGRLSKPKTSLGGQAGAIEQLVRGLLGSFLK